MSTFLRTASCLQQLLRKWGTWLAGLFSLRDSYLQALQQKLAEQVGIWEVFSHILTIAFKLGTVKRKA